MSHAPGLDRATVSPPGAGTNGVAMNAAAMAEPDRSWITTFQPFLSLLISMSFSSPPELDQYCPPNGSLCDGRRSRMNLQLKMGCRMLP
uniref:Uncharacterized protein n=1 Tax=Arundo donax TaxID=35708 RepID=A0A0A9GDF0_ARUDO